MRIITLSSDSLAEVPHISSVRGGGARRNTLEIQHGQVEELPGDLAGLLICGDLQGLEEGSVRLLGELVAETVDRLAGSKGIPSANQIGVLLAGDFYARPDPTRRGGLGDVTAVWRAFADRFRWVAGVLGNHDLLDTVGLNAHLLDGNCVHLDGLTIGGVGGIVGDPKRTNRKSAQEFCDLLLDVLAESPDLLLLHQGPALPEPGFPGNEEVTAALECALGSLVGVCGHIHWPVPLGSMGNVVQVLNADSRIILLLEKPVGA